MLIFPAKRRAQCAGGKNKKDPQRQGRNGRNKQLRRQSTRQKWKGLERKNPNQMHGHPRHSPNHLHQKKLPKRRQTRKKQKPQRSVSPLLRKRAHRQRKRFPRGERASEEKQNLMQLRIASDYRKHRHRASHNGHEKPLPIKPRSPQFPRQLSPNHRMKQAPHRSTISSIANGFLARKNLIFPNVFQNPHPKRNLAPTMETRWQIAEKPNHQERLALNQKEKQSPRREEDPREESKQAFSLVPIVCSSPILAFFSSVVIFLSRGNSFDLRTANCLVGRKLRPIYLGLASLSLPLLLPSPLFFGFLDSLNFFPFCASISFSHFRILL